jgi:hypothetical protein
MSYKYRLEDEPEIDDQNTYTLWKNSTISRLPDQIYWPLYHIQRQNVRIPLIKIFNNYYRLSPISNRQVTTVWLERKWINRYLPNSKRRRCLYESYRCVFTCISLGSIQPSSYFYSKSSKQQNIATSSTHAEIRALYEMTMNIVYLLTLFEEMARPIWLPTLIFEDNQPTIDEGADVGAPVPLTEKTELLASEGYGGVPSRKRNTCHDPSDNGQLSRPVSSGSPVSKMRDPDETELEQDCVPQPIS